MPRAAPGEYARGAVRRKLPEYQVVPVYHSDRRPSKCPHRSGMEICLHPYERGTTKCGSFTQQLSAYGVENGRLGEVVSLVGDCRPPPPGNPHQPYVPRQIGRMSDRCVVKLIQMCGGGVSFTAKMRKFGGDVHPSCVHFSLNNKVILPNLKDLNSSEYFKVNRSYSSCTGNHPVLKFGSFPLPPVRVNGSGTPIYSDYKCSRNIGIIYALPVL